MLVLPKGPSVGQSVFQFYVALTWFSQRWGKKAPQNLVVWTWFRRCLIGLPPLSLFLRVVHNNFPWTQHFCWSRSLEELSEWMQRVWGCDLVQLWGSTGNKDELRKCLCHAGQVFSPPLVTTELLTENPTLNLALYTLLLLCSPWSWSFAVNCGGPSVCTGRGPHSPPALFFPGCRNKEQLAWKFNLHILSEYFLWDSWEGPERQQPPWTDRKRARHCKAWIIPNSSLVINIMELWVIKWGFLGKLEISTLPSIYNSFVRFIFAMCLKD